MLKHRVIPALLLRDGGLVKTQKFGKHKYIGDPVNAIRIFNEKEVDELMVLDIDASRQRREPDYALIESVASECFMPLGYGGGISTVEQARQIFSSGVEKVVLQTFALENPKLVSDIAERFGSQSVVVSIDVKRDWLGRYRLWSASSRTLLKKDWLATLKGMVEAGAGEVLLNSVDCDGMQQGFDVRLIQTAAQAVDVPLVALGGASSLSDFVKAIQAGASAVAAGSLFVLQGPHRAVLISYPNYSELESLFRGNDVG
ncbi:AglZ/HisF2 family acetamidino modification protein [Pseudomonas sichuanensis]|uniref:AglZ/HisF2 family acetamidino modification protein n=1 Tax=Pseudomonas sichuanensis TaxID=2213015 RepID=UPI00215E9BC2|nr:AglZ/HisF2 family acetamidino modification protein [Pseudomonas sichuanensis]MDZ4017817.1 Imidazole glycerol phosphate synthase subunit HisF [Pseudomonas sichuanensis]UVL90719.1 AglZ/HisF2 family acetamidino modification protein [Pseudomonas sichuanensis]